MPAQVSRRAWMACGAAALVTAVLPRLAGAAPAPDRTAVRRVVEVEARSLRFPAPLALAVAHTESNFDPLARSGKGARGVMQIMPDTAWGEYGIHADQLWDARINVRLGIHFLGRLVQRYRGRTDLALSYYNGGSAVGDLPNARVLPATRGYVASVLAQEARYRREAFIGRGA